MTNKFTKEISDNMINTIKANKFKGNITLSKPLDLVPFVVDILEKCYQKNQTFTATIVVNDMDERFMVLSNLKTNHLLNEAVLGRKINIFTLSYVRDVISTTITSGMIIYYNDREDSDYDVVFKKLLSPFILSFSYSLTNSLKTLLTNIFYISRKTMIDNGYLRSVKEYYVNVEFSEEDEKLIEQYDNFINDCVVIFGDFKAAMAAHLGNEKETAEEVRYRIAIANGWSKELDLSNPYFKAISDVYSPQALYSKAKSFQDIIILRRKLISDNDAKINSVIELVKANPNKKIVIVSKRKDFAAKIKDSINATIKSEVKHEVTQKLFDTNKKVDFNVCEECYKGMESRSIYNPFDNDYLRYKTGNRKGEAKIFGDKSLCEYYLSLFNEGLINVLSITNTIFDFVEIEFDLLIYTSHECINVNEFRYKAAKFQSKTETDLIVNCIFPRKEKEPINRRMIETNSVDMGEVPTNVKIETIR